VIDNTRKEELLCNEILNDLAPFSEISLGDTEEIIPHSVSPKLLTRSIELLVEKLDLSYMDAILQAVSYFEITLSDIKKMLSPQIVDKLREEAVKIHLVRDDSKIEALF
jgi:hypothetical protein